MTTKSLSLRGHARTLSLIARFRRFRSVAFGATFFLMSIAKRLRGPPFGILYTAQNGLLNIRVCAVPTLLTRTISLGVRRSLRGNIIPWGDADPLLSSAPLLAAPRDDAFGCEIHGLLLSSFFWVGKFVTCVSFYHWNHFPARWQKLILRVMNT